MDTNPQFKPPRSMPEIQQEYQSLCTKAGHTQYQIYTLQKDLDAMYSTLRDLNFEAAAAQNAAAEAAKKAEEEAAAKAKDASAETPQPNGQAGPVLPPPSAPKRGRKPKLVSSSQPTSEGGAQ